MSFECATILNCDICGKEVISSGKRMSDCISRLHFEKYFCKADGWKVIYNKYHVCKECVEHYGMQFLRKKLKENEND